MKSLLVSSIYFPPQVGGISKYMASVVKYLGPEEICCLTGVQVNNRRTDNDFKARIYRRPRAFTNTSSIQALTMGAAAIEVLIRERPHIVQLATAFDGYLGLQLHRWFGLPFVIYAHGNDILDIATSSWPKPKRSLQRAACILANSRFTAELVANGGVRPEKIMVLHPGCDVERFQPRTAPGPLRQKLLGDHYRGRVIVTIGNLVQRKGHDMVIRALPTILQHVPDAVYLIVGDGPYRGELEKLATEGGLRGRVIFVGRIRHEQLPDVYALADVFVMPSRMQLEACDVEGFGLVFLEASACGKPIVAGRSGGISDAVVDGTTGFLVEPCDVGDVARRIAQILQSPALARQLGEQGRERVLHEFTWDHFARRLRAILSSVRHDVPLQNQSYPAE